MAVFLALARKIPLCRGLNNATYHHDLDDFSVTSVLLLLFVGSSNFEPMTSDQMTRLLPRTCPTKFRFQSLPRRNVSRLESNKRHLLLWINHTNHNDNKQVANDIGNGASWT